MSRYFTTSDIELLQKKFHGITVDNKVIITPVIRSYFKDE